MPDQTLAAPMHTSGAGSPQPEDVLEQFMTADETRLAAGSPEARPERDRRQPARFTDYVLY